MQLSWDSMLSTDASLKRRRLMDKRVREMEDKVKEQLPLGLNNYELANQPSRGN